MGGFAKIRNKKEDSKRGRKFISCHFCGWLVACGLSLHIWLIALHNLCLSQEPWEWLAKIEARAMSHSGPQLGLGLACLLAAGIGWLLAYGPSWETTNHRNTMVRHLHG